MCVQLHCFQINLKEIIQGTQTSGEQERVRFLSENFQNTVKRSLKGKLKYKGEKSTGSYFKVELKFLLVLTVKQSVCAPFLQRLLLAVGSLTFTKSK